MLRELVGRARSWYWRVRRRLEWAPIAEGDYVARLRGVARFTEHHRWF